MSILYLFIGLLASVFGALAGLGGGVIIKPVLDLISHDDVATIGILSASTVFSMAFVSLISAMRRKVTIKVKLSLLIAISSIGGGVIGKYIFNLAVERMQSAELLTLIQASMLAVIMIMIYIFVKFKHHFNTYQLKNPVLIISSGLILGMLAAFLGIGGGPLNVALLTLLFSMNAKEASLNSIFIIFFSQLSSIVFTASTTGFSEFNLTMLPYMVAGGVLGGLFGSRLVIRLKNRTVDQIFLVGIVLIIGINLVNIVKYFI